MRDIDLQIQRKFRLCGKKERKEFRKNNYKSNPENCVI